MKIAPEDKQYYIMHMFPAYEKKGRAVHLLPDESLMKSIVRVVADANAGGKPGYKLFRKERREYVQKSEKAKSQPGQRWC